MGEKPNLSAIDLLEMRMRSIESRMNRQERLFTEFVRDWCTPSVVLSARHRKILARRLHGDTYVQIGERFCMSATRAQQLCKRIEIKIDRISLTLNELRKKHGKQYAALSKDMAKLQS